MKKIAIAAVIALICSVSSFAQENYMSLEVGGALVKEFLKGNTASASPTSQGFFLGFNFDFGITDVFSVASETSLQTAFQHENTALLHTKYAEVALQEVVGAKFGFDIGRTSRLFFYAGPGLYVGLASNLKNLDTGDVLNYYANKKYSNLDVIAAAGVGYVFNSKFCVKFEYNHGLLNTCNLHGFTERSQRIMLGLSYFFGD